jgi:cell division protein FtsI/penicillin-binding protein 2
MKEAFLENRDFRVRLFMVLLFFLAFFTVLVARLFQLQIVYHQELSDRCEAQYLRNLEISAPRGNIYDKAGQLLATDLEVNSVYLSPAALKAGEDKNELAGKLSEILKIPRQGIEADLEKGTFFLWLKRKVSDEEAASVKNLKSPAVGLVKEAKRIYLKKSLLANVLGMTGLDNQGLAGIEFKYDQILRSQPGYLVAELDPEGQILFSREARFTAPNQGRDVYLTIDEFIQYHAEKILKEAVAKHSAAGGTIIAMEPATGRILALASYPTFDPNNYEDYPRESRRNRALNWLYEPGSTFKLVAVAAALNEGVVTPETTFYCPREFLVGGRRIKEAHDAISNVGLKTVNEIVTNSLNIGAAQIGLKLGREKLFQYIRSFGFGDRTGIDFPGEEGGLVRPYKTWAECDTGIIPFGQGIAVTPLQLLTAVAAIANGGLLVRPFLVATIKSPDSHYLRSFQPEIKKRLVSEGTAEKLKLMMEDVVKRGTATGVKTEGYRLAGKTGTAQKPIPGGLGYWMGHYVSSFIGFFPFEKPRVIILVLIDEPATGGYYGGVVAAPAFKKLAEEIIPYLKIPPDELTEATCK